MARRNNTNLKGIGILAGAILAGAYWAKPIMDQVHKFFPSLKGPKK